MNEKHKRIWTVVAVIFAIEFLLLILHIITLHLFNSQFLTILAGYMIFLLIAEVTVGIAAIPVFLVVILCRKLLKRKRLFPESKRILAVTVFCVAVLLTSTLFAATMGRFGKFPYFEICYDSDLDELWIKYDEEWIIGKTRDEIIARYGPFDAGSAYIIGDRHEDELDRDYLWMWFNKDGVCTSTERIGGYPGG